MTTQTDTTAARRLPLTTWQLICLARKYVSETRTTCPMYTSAVLCLEDAQTLALAGDDHFARIRAYRSLSYSVGLIALEAMGVEA